MARSYYIFQSGRLRRKGNTLYLEGADSARPSGNEEVDGAVVESADAKEMVLQDGEGSSPADALEHETRGESESMEYEDEDSFAQVSPTDSPQRRIIPIEDVAEIFLFGEITLNTKLLNFFAQKAIPVHVFNYYGFYSGSYYPRETNVSGHLLVKQVEHYTDMAKRLRIAREFARGAYHHLHRNLLYYRNRGKALEDAVCALEQEGEEIERADSIAALMGAEGRMREVYYRAFNEILNLETPFLKRVKRPPDNLINALISFGNSLLYAAVLSQIYRTPLNPTISYLHEPGTRRFSLALDIAEIFKPMIVDKMIFALINRQMIGDDDLIPEVGFAALKERARKVVVQEFEGRLQTTVKHRRLGRHVSYRGFIRLECYKLVRHLLGIEPYQALRAWW
ncbi:MAG: type I-B CRISPR-associated endonuclease Cas1b [Blastocatellia bacterium]|nr:type I-B CRISPR-associated endonuclease Cas1b [Blastocatellia bacterium]MCS7157547.1 type I-B CRISPR-associated endonuclease Cas1b [Blastocatellia bacterium]MCX7753499.1 type I-B CRISPR-associated endonuclease Cas1b [Blastocatellia bacterium]MDW8166914.1 type I-B CRISPR-associated endonuclease Cas1b [Acidobacteriota bacterium]MDW8257492.1 type I-B CRISPR-associated endonuclease Cas1b [Acidobacteriota bacterium]